MEDVTTKQPRRVFFIGPGGIDGARRDALAAVIGEVCQEPHYIPVYWFELPGAGSITTNIVGQILDAAVVVADLTDGNANVFYEVAVAHSTGVPVLAFLNAGQATPFSVQDQRKIPVRMTTTGILRDGPGVRTRLREALKWLEQEDEPPVTPIAPLLQARGWRQVYRRILSAVPEHAATSSVRGVDRPLPWVDMAKGGFLRHLVDAEAHLGMDVVSPTEGQGRITSVLRKSGLTKVTVRFDDGALLEADLTHDGPRLFVKALDGGD